MPRTQTTILGIHDGHDAGAALVRDGKVIAAVQEERLVNIKHIDGVPRNSIRTVFDTAKVRPDEVDAISVAALLRVVAPTTKEPPIWSTVFKNASSLLAHRTITNFALKVLHSRRKLDDLRKFLGELGMQNKEITFVEHHLCHAACAYRLSPWDYDEPALIMTADGQGDLVSSTVSVGAHGQISRIASSLYYDSLGNAFYSEITRFLGMTPWDHEYKVMGLAPYGRPDECLNQMKKIIDINPKQPLQFKNKIGAFEERVQPKLQKMLAGKRFDNIAAGAQVWLETLLVKWIQNAIKETGLKRVGLAGGIFLNVKANKKILETDELDDVFFYPAAGDEGIAAGAALEGYYQYCLRDGLKPTKSPLTDLYHGPSYDDAKIEQVLKQTGFFEKAERFSDIEGTVGELLSKGHVIARFSGGLEWGPRALGNRSILADPRDYKVVWKINSMIKHRDFWMPFGPSILEEQMNDYLVDARSAPYMILGFDTTARRDEIIAAIHPGDFTCRPQIVNDWNPSYREVLKSFEATTGVGGVLNTSFNVHGYPIVGTPELAVWTLQNSKLDRLAIGNYLVSR